VNVFDQEELHKLPLGLSQEKSKATHNSEHKTFAQNYLNNFPYPQPLGSSPVIESSEFLPKPESDTAHDWYSYILDTAVEGIWIVDSDSMLTLVNPKMAEMLGYGVADLIGQSLFNFVELEEADKVRQSDQNLTKSDDLDTGRYFRFLRCNGEPLVASISVTPLFNQDGSHQGTLGRIYDITQRLQYEQELQRSQAQLLESEQRYRLLALYATDIISLHSATDGKAVYVSNAALGLLGYEEADLIERSPMDLIHPEDQIRVELAYRVVTEQPISNCVSYRIRRQDQTYIWMESTLRLIASDRQVADSEKNETNEIRSEPSRDLAQTDKIVAVSRDVTVRREVEAELQISAERLRLAIESTQEGLWDWDLSRDSCYYSPHFYQIMGMDINSQILTPWTLLERLHPHDRAPAIAKLYNYIDGLTETYEDEFRIKHEAGHWIWLLARAKVEGRNQNQVAQRLVGTFADISDRKVDQANLQRQYQKELLIKRITTEIRQTIDANRILDTTANELGQALRVSRCLIHSYETTPIEQLNCVGEYLDNQVTSLLSLGVNVQEHPFCQALLSSDQVITATNVFQSPLLTSLYGLCHSVQLKSILAIRTSYLGQPNGAILLHQCDRYRPWTDDEIEILEVVAAQVGIAIAQAELLAHEKKQTEELANQNAALAIANQKAQAASLAKSEFLAMMSHEIRTPMNAIIGMTEILLRANAEPSQKEMLEVVLGSSDILLGILNDILDFSKVESGKLDLEISPFNLRDCIESTFDLMANNAAEKNLSLAYGMVAEVPRWLNGDQLRLKQVITNLLSNSVKFSTTGEVVLTVQVRNRIERSETEDQIKHEQDHQLEFAVHDSGIGIDPSKMELLFQPFSQIDSSTTRQFGGTGLGLAICKRLCELMGGRMWVVSNEIVAGNPPPGWTEAFMAQRSESGRPDAIAPIWAQSKTGSSFYFTINADNVTEDSNSSLEQAKRSDQPNSLQGKVLLASDHDTSRHLISRQLREWGLQTRLADSQLELLALLKNGEHFDVAIIDLPEAVAIAYAMRKLPSYQNISLAIVRDSSLEQLKELESIIYFRKPLKQSQLYEYLSKILSSEQKSANQPLSPPKVLDSETLPSNASLRILLTEDNLVNQKVAQRMLQHLGFSADVANNGLEAVAAIEVKKYDLILMDIQMPEMDGIKASQTIRQIEAKQGIKQPIKIIAMTANAMSGDREMCLAAGMDDYVSKPVSIQKLAEILSHCQLRT